MGFLLLGNGIPVIAPGPISPGLDVDQPTAGMANAVSYGFGEGVTVERPDKAGADAAGYLGQRANVDLHYIGIGQLRFFDVNLLHGASPSLRETLAKREHECER